MKRLLKEDMNAQDRKEHPLARGLLDYFPDALLAVANCSHVGNEQHNPGEALHWAKAKSTDEADAIVRHLIDRGSMDTDGVRHSAKVAWRALALLQRELDAERLNKQNGGLGLMPKSKPSGLAVPNGYKYPKSVQSISSNLDQALNDLPLFGYDPLPCDVEEQRVMEERKVPRYFPPGASK